MCRYGFLLLRDNKILLRDNIRKAGSEVNWIARSTKVVVVIACAPVSSPSREGREREGEGVRAWANPVSTPEPSVEELILELLTCPLDGVVSSPGGSVFHG